MPNVSSATRIPPLKVASSRVATVEGVPSTGSASRVPQACIGPSAAIVQSAGRQFPWSCSRPWRGFTPTRSRGHTLASGPPQAAPTAPGFATISSTTDPLWARKRMRFCASSSPCPRFGWSVLRTGGCDFDCAVCWSRPSPPVAPSAVIRGLFSFRLRDALVYHSVFFWKF
jgi:hypothetical protein